MRLIDFIRSHIASMDFDKIMLTADFLEYGSRASVDLCLSRLVGSGVLRRLANGVFVRTGSKTITAEEIATAKAERFGKTIYSGRGNLAGATYVDDNSCYVFATDARTSSFGTIHGRINLVHDCRRNKNGKASYDGKCCESIVVYELNDPVAQRTVYACCP